MVTMPAPLRVSERTTPVLPVDASDGRSLEDPRLLSESFADPPAVSKLVQVPDHGAVGLHVLVPGDAIVVPTQTPDGVAVSSGQDDL